VAVAVAVRAKGSRVAVDWWWRGGQVSVVVEWGLLVNCWWRMGARSRVLAVEWRSSGGGG
jgi:hypothetical protein